ncbi:protein bcp1 [Lichtheimia corymbifera JMRC:FSU:9682]|uniref:Protein BCP1 n=1 Tax=Lichtheimia corymbifera JMRC:FSU:9682 TaxID=1263082 RepID=A0A068RJ87_9FUNG|nr:protein bcp1 [Lichtheimia corymbifera JMRC:FSU:9682]
MKRKTAEGSGSESDSDAAPDIVDVDFDFFNPEQIDYHALKRLFGQLFSTDAELINLGDIVDILLEENHVGTTVKVDGQESDPYAILSIVNLNHFKDNEGVKSLRSYLLSKCPKKNVDTINAIMAPESKKHVGWVVSERFINMPMEIMPPMYNMMQEETKQAKQNGEAYDFEWYMFITKTYKEVEPVVDKEEGEDEPVEQPKKKAKKKAASAAEGVLEQDTETFYFQPEDEVINKYAQHQFDYKFTNREKESSSDARRAFSDFGIAPFRRLMFVHHSKMDALVKEIEKTCSMPTA